MITDYKKEYLKLYTKLENLINDHSEVLAKHHAEEEGGMILDDDLSEAFDAWIVETDIVELIKIIIRNKL